MKKSFISLIICFIAIIIYLSCKKPDISCEGCINGNKSPKAIAGPDQVITLPTDSISLDGTTSSDPDGTISEWLWKKISGPASYHIGNSAVAKTIVNSLDTGLFKFELTVTDDGGLSAKDTIQITVYKQLPGNRAPVANAGIDQVITLPANSALLDGGNTADPDNNIVSYLWTEISGPSFSAIVNADRVFTQVNNLVEGIYIFELAVTDQDGLFSRDTVEVIVINPLCEPSGRPIVSAQLIPFGNLSQARSGTAAVSGGDKLFFAGGFNGSGVSGRVDIYDMSSGSWTTAELSIPRHYLSAVAAGGKIFFAGGYSVGANSRVDIYDLASQSWTIAELSQARAYIVTASVGNKVFFAGGSGNDGNSARVDIYDLSANSWSIANLSEAKIGFTATTVDNKVYFAGGDPDNSGPASTKIDIYDNETNTWSTSNLNTPRAFHAAIYKAGKIFWAGGATYLNYQGGIGNEDLISCQVEIRDLSTQVSSFASLSYPKYVNKAFEKDNKIGIVSSYSGWWEWQDLDIYDLGTDSWYTGKLSQAISSGASIISANNTIYVAGGILCNGNPVCQYLTQVWKLEF